MLNVEYSSQFKKDYKRITKRGLNIAELIKVMKMLENEISLDEKYKDHSLINNWSGYRECHIQPDWLLIYKITAKTKKLYFARTGTHSDLFN